MDGVPLTFLIQTLRNEVVSLGKKLRGLSQQIGSLTDDLEFFTAKLEKWAKCPITDGELKVLVKHFREAVYEAEDILAEYLVHKEEYESKNRFQKLFVNPLGYPQKLLGVAQKIAAIRTKVDRIQVNLNTVEELPVGESSGRAPFLPSVDENYLVGFKEEQEIIKNDLTGGSDVIEVGSDEIEVGSDEIEVGSIEPKVIALCAMPGSGKSKLADWILRNPTIAKKFKKCIWVSVSQNFSTREVFLRILKHFTEVDDKIRGMDTRDLVEQLHIFLMRETYLIVMDDVCTIKDWEDLKCAFLKSKPRSRILLTTCSQDVAKLANRNKDPVALKFLSDDESLALLTRKALGLTECPVELINHAKNIVRECGGLPLAIVMLGGILRGIGSDSHGWKDVSEDVGRYIVPNGRGETNFTDFSFYQLPYPLKACFLHFGMFPKGSKIPVKQLTRWLIVGGFVEKEGKKRLENTAKDYLNYLLNKTLVMIGKRSPIGKVKTVYVHDVVHEFCKRKAAEENLYCVIENNDTNLDGCHRISIHSPSLEFLSSRHVGTHARSFLFSSPGDITLQPTRTIYLLKNNKLLQIFDAKIISFAHFPKELSRLVHLRYLVLHIRDNVLPKRLSNLWNLQSLIVHSPSEKPLEIKADVWKMRRLTHVKTDASISWPSLFQRKKKKEGFSGHKGLIELSVVLPETCTKDTFEMAPNIEKLGIRGKLAKLFEVIGEGRSLFANVVGLNSLENLKLINDVLNTSDLESQIIDFPGEFPEKLEKLTLIGIQLDDRIMSALGKLENLETLKLKSITFKEMKWVMKTRFPNLKVLHIEKALLRFWEASEDQFPKLRHVCLIDCTHLSKMPLSFASVSSLEAMELERTTISAATSAKQIEKQKTDGGYPFKLSINSAA